MRELCRSRSTPRNIREAKWVRATKVPPPVGQEIRAKGPATQSDRGVTHVGFVDRIGTRTAGEATHGGTPIELLPAGLHPRGGREIPQGSTSRGRSARSQLVHLSRKRLHRQPSRLVLT
jgi:hypothetical protein